MVNMGMIIIELIINYPRNLDMFIALINCRKWTSNKLHIFMTKHSSLRGSFQ
jgi:hypothetical protein